MTARGFDYYDQMTATAVLPTPTPTPTVTATVAAVTPTATRRGSDRLMRGSAYLLLLAGALFLAALVVAVSPVGAIDADITVPFLVACACGVGASAWVVTR